jgi:hypothetical protein
MFETENKYVGKQQSHRYEFCWRPLWHLGFLVFLATACGVRGDPVPPEAPPLLRSHKDERIERPHFRGHRVLPLSGQSVPSKAESDPDVDAESERDLSKESRIKKKKAEK